eukprot:gnl/MRDRNA2_/MRDRNA2_80100_c0_seq2.p1 gnl/MRDRNA2_/MRDRNA2_80100_c0~~gnl/MRDRNA2_/MRDRNA2_80100_c0_seq2.p1  ORF type:complete len:156 (+),score=26.93 gnl/MRDRNA2_/MRDRNA2_80100_c0_seq2:61-468(+)
MNTTVREQKKAENRNAPEVTQPSSSSASAEPTSPKGVKKTIQKEKLPAGADIPSKMTNIQVLHEQLTNGKNKGWITNVEWLDIEGLLKEHTEATKTSNKTKEEKKRDTARRNEIKKELQKIYAGKVWPKIKSLKK